uniref:NAD-dependent epimerase/dehydratase domain-containing protein n=1 Tax=Oryza brachyantha TaxID=4533 RepID=J3MFY7_ORYBR
MDQTWDDLSFLPAYAAFSVVPFLCLRCALLSPAMRKYPLLLLSGNWYCLSKTLAEREAWRYAADSNADMDVVTVCPPLILGPLLQSTVNTSSSILINLLNGDREAVAEDKRRNAVDVRDVADALALAYENTAASGRLICSAYNLKTSEMAGIVRRFCPDINSPKFVDGEDERVLSSEKLQKLGWKFRAVEECLRDSVRSYKTAGILK